MLKSTNKEIKYIMNSHLRHCLIELLLTILQTSFIGRWNHSLPYDPDCKYKVKVQIALEDYCGTGMSESSDEVEYGNVMLLISYYIALLLQ